jgi:hypothetical protein
METNYDYKTSISDGIRRAQKIFQGLRGSTVSDFADLSKFPTTSTFIVQLNEDSYVQLDTSTNEWCKILFITKKEKEEVDIATNGIPINHLDELADKIAYFCGFIEDDLLDESIDEIVNESIDETINETTNISILRPEYFTKGYIGGVDQTVGSIELFDIDYFNQDTFEKSNTDYFDQDTFEKSEYFDRDLCGEFNFNVQRTNIVV